MIVTIQMVDGSPAWPDTTSTFIHPGHFIGTEYIIEYTGQEDLSGIEYVGDWPIVIPMYRLIISAPEFLSLFTATEFGNVYASVIPEIVQLRKMLEVSHDVFDLSTNVLINTGIDALVVTALLTAERAAEIRLGYPESV